MSLHRSSRAGLLVLLAGTAAMLGLSQCGQDASPAAVPAVSSTTVLAPATVSSTLVASSTEPSTTALAAPSLPPSTVTSTTIAAPAAGCTPAGSSAGVDRLVQRAWLCENGTIVATFPITSAWSMPDPGVYPIYAKDMHASSNFGGHFSTMTHFIAFSYGKNTGARVAFHSVPVLTNGEFVQPLASVGDPARRGESSGCIRVLPEDAVMLWDALDVGDTVTVLT
jgi:lipoprotein-anchoring transpeptidase ErfK/SrfK